ncbi:hypothetical protein MA16_Dca001079 [Dendrobium catenatum]|uniref:Uncharacterized protein n=1 Tax=Dendrobium catenatum TaxID=906689 RepID=A0A2I0WLE5_9ASPA|nr:hypothetical protein MA16_Dca001079 [Dendrobium catenatum]
MLEKVIDLLHLYELLVTRAIRFRQLRTALVNLEFDSRKAFSSLFLDLLYSSILGVALRLVHFSLLRLKEGCPAFAYHPYPLLNSLPPCLHLYKALLAREPGPPLSHPPTLSHLLLGLHPKTLPPQALKG